MSLKRKNPMIETAAAISAGLIRSGNEDNFCLCSRCLTLEEASMVGRGVNVYETADRNDGVLLGVFDGMGGEDCGEIASCLSATEAAKLYPKLKKSSRLSAGRQMLRFFPRADGIVSAEAKRLGVECAGSTATLLWLSKGRATAANLGDSRIYIIRGDRILQLSHDHTELQHYVDIGRISQEQADRMPRSHCITQFIGMGHAGGRKTSPRMVKGFELKPDDLFILCSDGLTDMLADETLLELARSSGLEPSTLAPALVCKALEAGGHDNVTVLVARVLPENHIKRTPPKADAQTEAFAEPEAPDIPETPDSPDMPETPDMPEAPDMPETPDVPDVPETPEAPDAPDAPEKTNESI